MQTGKAIQLIRKKRRVSQKTLAKKMRMSQSMMSLIESGKREVDPDELKQICKVLKVPQSLVQLYALEEKDCAPRKRAAYRLIMPSVQDMVSKLLN